MRPLRLEISGFSAFREPIEVDFSDADYFAFVGPTGAGKSSLIDALTFALYGSIPRLAKGAVLPVVSQGRQEMRVRFDFAVGDREYTAVRVVRKLGEDRATTKEARLEHADTVLAGDADGVTAEVERLLGLGFDEFTRCVVLPQGDFARFMHDKPADRQNLLVKLLDLDIYERMLQRANLRAVEADVRAKAERQRLDDLSFATEDSLKAARAQVATLTALQERIDADEPRLVGLREAFKQGQERAKAAERAAGLLEKIETPQDVATLATEIARAVAATDKADEAVVLAEATLKERDAGRAELPARAPLDAALAAHTEIAKISKALAAAQKTVATLEKEQRKAAKAAIAAEKISEEAGHAMDAARLQHRAYDLARELVAGEPCPVCGQAVHELPAISVPADLEAAEKRAADARAAHKTAAEEIVRIERDAAVAVDRVTSLQEDAAALADALSGHPNAEALTKQLGEIEAAEKALDAARRDADAARATARKARATAETAGKGVARARRTLDAARDGVAEFAPPPLSREDLATDWNALTLWAREEASRRRAGATDALEAARTAKEEADALIDAQRQACIDAGMEDVTNPRDDTLKAIERTRERAAQIEFALESAKEIGDMVRALEERGVVARELGKHLKANAFERWVLRQALTTLVDGATGIMLELSSGQYSLTLDKQFNFAVVDHRNADATRSARTLSGGETFLASLALALAMSDRIAQLSANTAVRLESIFLDEGFGSLDAETLETVATAIEQLGRTSRVVGIVTHVRDLAERIPVRFEVRRGPTTSTVEKVLA